MSALLHSAHCSPAPAAGARARLPHSTRTKPAPMPESPVANIAPATRADLPDLMRLIRALAVYEKLEHLVVADEAALDAALFGPGANCEALIARAPGADRGSEAVGSSSEAVGSSGEAVGFALYFHNFSTFLGRKGLYLEDLFVVPEHRGAGLGRALLERLATIAVQRGCGRFEWTVLDWNTPAIGFYEAMGAQVLPDWRIVRVAGDALRRMATG